MTRIEALGAVPARALWLLLAVVSTPTISDAIAGHSNPVVAVATVGLGIAWTTGAVALLVARSASLTVLRLVVPAGLAAMVAAVIAGGAPDGADLATLVVAALAVAGALAPWVAEAWVDGSAYGPEQRAPLRTPPLLLFVVAPVTWAVVVAGVAAGPLLLATRQWAAGATTLVVGWAAALAGVRSLHQLARRWVVVVPAGLVLHDPLSMPEAQLFLRASIERVGPAEADADDAVTEDLTAGAAGLALELVATEPVEVLVRSGRRTATTRTVDRVLFTPTRPRTVLEAAQARRIPVT